LYNVCSINSLSRSRPLPKVVDHEQRRREIVRAVLRAVARGGVRAADVRSIAREAGWSTGVITHYFADKHALLVGALREAAADVVARMESATRLRSGVDRVEALLLAGLPLDEEAAATCRIFYHFAAEGLSDPAFVEEFAAYYAGWRGAVAQALAATPALRPLTPDQARAAAVRLVALVEGLAVQAVFDPSALTPNDMRAIVIDGVARLARPPFPENPG
jgi:AcrR family transcriptional regulator